MASGITPLIIWNNTYSNGQTFIRIDYYPSLIGSVQLDDVAISSTDRISASFDTAIDMQLCFTYDGSGYCIPIVKDANSYTIKGFTVQEWIQTSLADLQPSLASAGAGINGLILSNGTLINGAHSRPASRLVASGEKTFWVAGDWGNDGHGTRDGVVGLAEIGMGYNHGPVQLNLSLGYAGSDQSMVHGGKAEHRGTHLMLEGLIPLNGDQTLIATLGLFGQWGSLDTRRGFDNAGTIEYSIGDTDTRAWGVRTRVDWIDALSVNTTRLSPYADLW